MLSKNCTENISLNKKKCNEVKIQQCKNNTIYKIICYFNGKTKDIDDLKKYIKLIESTIMGNEKKQFIQIEEDR